MTGETQKTEFASATGDQLSAALELPSGRPRAFALFAHCFTCSKDIKAAREIARALRAQGFAVLRFDFTGLGGSAGDFANTNFSSNIEDLVAAADFLRREFEAPSLLVGHSLGGAAAIVAATRIPEVKAVATIGAPSDAAHVAGQLKGREADIRESGEAEVQLAGRPFKIKAQFLDDLNNQNVIECAKSLKKPLLVMHAPLDETVGIDNATEIFVAARHPKSFVSLDTADHLLSNSDDARYAANVLAPWAARYLDGDIVQRPEEKRADALDGAKATMIADKKFAVQVNAAGHTLTIDADKEDGGDGLGPNPTRLTEAALAACAVITMRMYARRKGWAVERLEAEVERAAGADAHASKELVKTVTIAGPLDREQIERIAEIGDKCPVHRMLTENVMIRSKIA